MSLQTIMTGTLREAEQALAEVSQRYHEKQNETGRLTRELASIDQDPQTLTGETFAQREADRRNWTRERAQLQQETQMLLRAVEGAQATVQQLKTRAKELPKVIDRLRFALTKEGSYGGAVRQAEGVLQIAQQQLAQGQQRLRMLETELQTVLGSEG